MSTASVRSPVPRPKLTVEQYLATERVSLHRHLYLDGLVIPLDGDIVEMAGEKLPHGIISLNIGTQLNIQLKGTPCFAVTKDTKVRSGLGLVSLRSVSGMFSYPDILVVCGEPEYFDDQGDIIMNPTAIVEVLSKSTEAFDRGEKFQRYRTWNPSLRDYVLVTQDKPLVEHFHRNAAGSWDMHEAIGLTEATTFASISCTLNLADIYDRIKFPESSDDM
ncbi:MAG: Uma2 family endonuclease [Gemmataceae bacterium]|nr:Uma2 family endonuclease [Gemmataceae bacterium]